MAQLTTASPIRVEKLLQKPDQRSTNLYFAYCSGVVGPRHPFKKDPDLDYDADSDEEWEEVHISVLPCLFCNRDRTIISSLSPLLYRRILVKVSPIVRKIMRKVWRMTILRLQMKKRAKTALLCLMVISLKMRYALAIMKLTFYNFLYILST